MQPVGSTLVLITRKSDRHQRSLTSSRVDVNAHHTHKSDADCAQVGSALAMVTCKSGRQVQPEGSTIMLITTPKSDRRLQASRVDVYGGYAQAGSTFIFWCAESLTSSLLCPLFIFFSPFSLPSLFPAFLTLLSFLVFLPPALFYWISSLRWSVFLLVSRFPLPSVFPVVSWLFLFSLFFSQLSSSGSGPKSCLGSSRSKTWKTIWAWIWAGKWP